MNFADGQRRTCRLQIFSLPSANENFADGKCPAGRRQVSRWPTASVPLADGKCPAGRRQNSYRINGKYKFCQRQIFCLPTANCPVCTYRPPAAACSEIQGVLYEQGCKAAVHSRSKPQCRKSAQNYSQRTTKKKACVHTQKRPAVKLQIQRPCSRAY